MGLPTPSGKQWSWPQLGHEYTYRNGPGPGPGPGPDPLTLFKTKGLNSILLLFIKNFLGSEKMDNPDLTCYISCLWFKFHIFLTQSTLKKKPFSFYDSHFLTSFTLLIFFYLSDSSED